MKDARELADWILREISHLNPHSSRDKTLAFAWAVGFLARIVAEMIWRDNRNLDLFRRIRGRNRPK